MSGFDETKYRTVPCRYFRSGNCVKGDECTFLHEDRPSYPRRPLFCQYFAKHGTCRYGDACRFSHDRNAAVRPPRRTGAPSTICRYFAEGGCRFGDNCRFEHRIPDGSEVEVNGL